MSTASRSQFKPGAALAIAALAACSALTSVAADGTYPEKAIRIIVPFTAGSATDIIARAVGEGMRKDLGQPIIVENKPGAGGTLGAAQVAAAQPDGYTLLVHSAGHVANSSLYPNLRYDPIKDFKPVGMLASVPNVLVVNPAKGYKNLGDLVAKAKAEPGHFVYASAGNGSATHMNAEKFRIASKVEAVHVPYKGTPEAMTDVIAGQVDWFFAPITSAIPMVKEHKLQALAVGSSHRATALPDVPTTVEAGFPNSDYDFWIGLFAPGKLPAAQAERLSKAVSAALKSDAVKTRLTSLGANEPTMEPAQFAAFVNSESAAATKLIAEAKIKQN